MRWIIHAQRRRAAIPPRPNTNHIYGYFFFYLCDLTSTYTTILNYLKKYSLRTHFF